MRKLLFSIVLLLAVSGSWAEGVFRVNGEDITKMPSQITLDYSRTGYVLVQFEDGSVVSYNMNLVEYYQTDVTAVQNAKNEGLFFHIRGHVGDMLYLDGVTPGAELAIYAANGVEQYRGKANGMNMSVDVSRLTPGTYILRVDRRAVKFIKK